MTAPVPFPFVVGSDGSGAMVVGAILDSHPELAVPGESHFIPKMSHLRGFLDVVFTDEHVRTWGLDERTVRARFAAAPPSTYSDAVRLLYACYAHAQGKPRYGDTTPPYVRQLPLLAGLFPEARFVHVIRDGRDVALALMGAGSIPGPMEEAAEQWRTAVEEGRQGGAALGDRYTELRYEALVADPEPELRRVCAFLELDYSPAMGPAPTAGPQDWRRDMDPVDTGVMWLLAGSLLAELGYPPDERGVPAAARARRVLRHRAEKAAGRYRRGLQRRRQR